MATTWEQAMTFWLGILLGLGVGGGLHWRFRHQTLKAVQSLASSLDLDLRGQGLAEGVPRIHRALRKYQQSTIDLTTAAVTENQDWQQLAEHLPLGFLLVDQNNLVIHCNLAAQHLLQIKNWQPRIKVLLEWIRSYELDQLVEQARDASEVRAGSVQAPQVEEWLFYPSAGDGKPIPLRAWAVVLSEAQVGILVEDRLEAKTLIQQRDRWASDVAHELKTPLTSIRLVAETLQPRVDPPLRTWVDRLLNETIRLGNLVQDLLELSNLNLAAGSALQLVCLDLVPILQEAWESLEPQAAKRQQRLDYQGPELLVLWGDQQRLYRLFLNLLDNSIKYSKPDTAIHVRMRREAEQIEIEVYDHGQGLAANAFQAVFEPFYRTDTARARSAGGTGLGLAIVRQIVEAHGGSVAAANHPETGGLWIRLSLNAHSQVLKSDLLAHSAQN